jgi:Ca2+-transporting ATPase
MRTPEDKPNLDLSPQPETSGEARSWHASERDQVLVDLGTSPEMGLSQAEAQRRLGARGPNELVEARRPSLWRMVLDQFDNFIVIVLILAALVSGILGDLVEAGAILAIVILNAVLGVIQERRAEEALGALRKLAAPEAHVIRDGHRKTIPAREVVPGDIVVLEAGNFVPADLRLIETVNLRIEEAALTGESEPVDKDASIVLRQDVPLGDRLNTAFMGTVVTYGRGRGVVVGTGMLTQIGMIARMLQSVEEEPTPLQRRLDQLGKTLGWAALLVCALVFGIGWMRGYEPLEMFLVAVSLAVAAVPEGLPAVVTITLALGMREMISRHALIRRLSSVETLGSTTVICSDKTGTLTQNQMTVTKLWVDGLSFDLTGSGLEPKGEFLRDGTPVDLTDYPGAATALWVAALANDAELEPVAQDETGVTYRAIGDPTEAALIVAAAKVGARRENLALAYPRIDEIPFDSTRKRMTTVHKVKNPLPEDISPFYDTTVREWEVATTKGAPDVILPLCTKYQRTDDTPVPMTEAMRDRILAANAAMAGQALRVLTVAYRVEQDVPDKAPPDVIERDLTFVGLVGMIDPARPEARPAIDKARRAGIRTVMITGDYPDTARAIADEIGLLERGHRVLTGRELETMDAGQLEAIVMRTDVYARVSPEHKMRIVDALKAHDQIVAMTGDGVNDAPALKRADIGVGMGITGTDVVKETADMVLTDDNFASIVAAVEQGRVIYANIRKFVYYLLSCNIAEIAVIFIAILAGLPSPLTPIQLLWLNLITDGAPALALGLEKGDPDTMDRSPRPAKEPIVNRTMRIGIAAQTIAIAGVTLTAYLLGLRAAPDMPQVGETMAFVTLSFSELLRAFTARSERFPLYRLGVFSNRAMIYAVASSLALLLLVLYTPFLQPVFDTYPLPVAAWEIVLPLLVMPAVVAELTKWVIRAVERRPQAQEVPA